MLASLLQEYIELFLLPHCFALYHKASAGLYSMYRYNFARIPATSTEKCSARRNDWPLIAAISF
jgi:hypothetical protein